MEKTSNEVKLQSQKRGHHGLFFISPNISELQGAKNNDKNSFHLPQQRTDLSAKTP